MRILFTSTPGAGHINPLVPLARAMTAAGHDVLWAVPQDAEPHLRRLGFTTVACGMSLNVRHATMRPLMPQILSLEPEDRQRPMFATIFGQISARPMFEELLPVAEQFSPSAVIHEPNELAAAPVARAVGVPHVTVGFGRLHPDALLDAARGWATPLWERAGTSEVPPALGLYEYLYLHPLPPTMEAAPAGRPILPMRPVSAEAEDLDAPDWLEPYGRDRPGIYVTFGTEFGPFAPIASTIDACGDLDADVLVTVGAATDMSALPPERDRPANVRVETYVPQHQVLSRVALVVSHAGSGVMMGAAAAGKPQVAMPIGADQLGNALLIERCGLGAAVLPDRQDRDGIAEAIERVLRDATCATSASQMASDFADMASPASFVASIEHLGARS